MAEESPYTAPELSEWDQLPRGPSGRPMISVGKDPEVAPEAPYTFRGAPLPPAEEPDTPPDFNPWERAAERVRRSNVDKLPTPEMPWAKIGSAFKESANKTAVDAIKSFYETTDRRYYPPDAASIGDDGTFYDKDGNTILDQTKPVILPLTKDPQTDETQGALPGALDMMNTIGSPVKGAATLGAGLTRGPRNPFGGGPLPPPPGMGHNQGPPMPPGGAIPPPPHAAPPGVTPPPPREIIRGHDSSTPMSWDEFYTKTIDDLHPLKVLQNKVAEHGALTPDEKFYELGRLTRGSHGRSQQALENSTFDYHTLQNNGISFMKVIKPVLKNLDDFENYAVSVRDIELLNRGINPGVSRAEAMAKIAAAPPEFRGALKNLHAYQDRVLQYFADSGMLSPNSMAAIKRENRAYVPFSRLMDRPEIGVSGSNLKAWDPVRRIKGSDRPILSPLETIVKNTHALMDLAEKNRALNALVDSADARGLTGLVERVPGPARGAPGEDQIKVWKNGVPSFYSVDPEVAKAINGMGKKEIDLIMNIVSVPARTLRAGSVLSLEFLAKNLTRDQLAAAIFSKNSYVPYVDYLRGLGHMMVKSEQYQNWLKSGGANSNFVTMERSYIHDQLDKMRQTGWYDKIKNNSNPIKFLEKASEYSEQPTRIGEFVKSQKKGKTLHEGGFDAREVSVDFGRHGASQLMRYMSSGTAFFNPTLQGHDKLARALFTGTPRERASAWFKVGAYITAPTLMAYAYNRQDPRMMDIPRQERDTFWHFPTNDWQPITAEQATMIPPGWKKKEGDQNFVNMGTIHRLPKPHEMGVVFGSTVERGLDAYFEKHPEAWKGFYKSLASAAIPPMLPQIIGAPVEAWTNYKFFTEAPLVPKRLHSPKDRRFEYTPFTTETAKIVGNAIGQITPNIGPFGREGQLSSPIVLENYQQNWSGTLGRYTLQILDAAIEGGKQVGAKIAGKEYKPKVKPEWSEADYPGWKAFVTRLPATSAQGVRDFYENVESSTTIKALMNRIAKSPEYDTDEQRLAARGDIAGGALPIKMAKTAVGVNRMFRAMEMINENKKMTPKEKRQAIDMLSLQIMYATGEANRAFAEAQKQQKQGAP